MSAYWGLIWRSVWARFVINVKLCHDLLRSEHDFRVTEITSIKVRSFSEFRVRNLGERKHIYLELEIWRIGGKP